MQMRKTIQLEYKVVFDEKKEFVTMLEQLEGFQR